MSKPPLRHASRYWLAVGCLGVSLPDQARVSCSNQILVKGGDKLPLGKLQERLREGGGWLMLAGRSNEESGVPGRAVLSPACPVCSLRMIDWLRVQAARTGADDASLASLRALREEVVAHMDVVDASETPAATVPTAFTVTTP